MVATRKTVSLSRCCPRLPYSVNRGRAAHGSTTAYPSPTISKRAGGAGCTNAVQLFHVLVPMGYRGCHLRTHRRAVQCSAILQLEIAARNKNAGQHGGEELPAVASASSEAAVESMSCSNVQAFMNWRVRLGRDVLQNGKSTVFGPYARCIHGQRTLRCTLAGVEQPPAAHRRPT
jgi:hypothetical protein